MSYFAKPNFIIYDEWFDEDLEKKKLDCKNKKIQTIMNIHEFYYEKSNFKVGASENNLQREINFNKKELFDKSYFGNKSDKYAALSNRKFVLFEKSTKNKIKFNITKKIFYPLSIFGFIFISGILLFFISQSKKNESNIKNQSTLLEKRFAFSKKNH